jgi:hypothetical protein
VVGELGSRVGEFVIGVRVGLPDMGASVGGGVRARHASTKAQQKCSGSSHSEVSPDGQGWWQFSTTSFQSIPVNL